MLGRLLCFVGIHHWIPARWGKGMYCDRSSYCRYHGMVWRG